MPQSLSAVNIHFLSGTKNRAPFITDTVAPELHAYIGGIILGLGFRRPDGA
jgi:hypothetical protein